MGIYNGEAEENKSKEKRIDEVVTMNETIAICY